MATWCGSTDKKKIREKRSSSSQSSDTDMEEITNASSTLDLEFGIRDEKRELRKTIVEVYEKILEFLSREEYDAELRKELANNYSLKDKKLDKENYEIILEERKKDIERMERGIPISGETSSGKTSLINKLVGQELFCPKARPATAKICRISPSEEVCLKLSDANDKVIDAHFFSGFGDLKKIRTLLEKNSDLKKSIKADPNIHYIDVFCPFGNLKTKGNMMLVDTPGIGTSEELTNMLLRYLPSAIAFVFIINVSNAGGVQEDRIVKILETILTNLYKMPCFDPKDVLFVTNKWNMLKDQMKEGCDDDEDDDNEDDDDNVDEMQETWDDVKETIKKIWPVFEEDTIFKLYLKTINPDDGSDEERADFERFTKRLLDLSRKNTDSKIAIHLRLLKDDMNRIKRGINARINTAAKGDRKRIEVEKSLKEMKTLKESSLEVHMCNKYKI
ncbi:uncharacterized protein LOC134276885 [Saccostrea cucullata]|uniref:uncharacterized protein LOC134276885 n=1 Tax=Saccostrea cuccullata TaxID=36930 RepID=UPI002ED08A42